MYVNSAYWHNSRIDFKDRKHPLFVGSCGTYRLISRPKLPTHRPRGRLDFQLLYIAAGKAYFYWDKEEHIIPAGNMVLYRPREEQRYYYYGIDQTEVFWVHFTGNNVTNILRRYGLDVRTHVIHSGTSLEYKRLFQQMIQELQECREDYEEMLVYYLHMLFISLHRLGSSGKGKKNFLLSEEMDRAVQSFHKDYAKLISIEDYAAQHGMSVSWFIRSFKAYTGTTPAQYLVSLRIAAAQRLLETSGMNVGEIAAAVGYDNPFYFSRLFHRQCGISPREFRRQLQESQDEGKNSIE